MVYTSYFADVLFIVQAVDDRTRAEEEHSFEERVCTDVKEC